MCAASPPENRPRFCSMRNSWTNDVADSRGTHGRYHEATTSDERRDPGGPVAPEGGSQGGLERQKVHADHRQEQQPRPPDPSPRHRRPEAGRRWRSASGGRPPATPRRRGTRAVRQRSNRRVGQGHPPDAPTTRRDEPRIRGTHRAAVSPTAAAGRRSRAERVQADGRRAPTAGGARTKVSPNSMSAGFISPVDQDRLLEPGFPVVERA